MKREKEKEFCKEALADYIRYSSYLKGEKTAHSDSVTINDLAHGNNGRWNYGFLKVDHSEGIMDLEVEISKRDQNNFKFKLFARGFSRNCLFRYDSYGHYHYNESWDEDQQVSLLQIGCPHYHSFTETGYSRAYQSEAYQNNANKQEFLSIAPAMFYYCQEANLRALQNDWLEIDFADTQMQMFEPGHKINKIDKSANY